MANSEFEVYHDNQGYLYFHHPSEMLTFQMRKKESGNVDIGVILDPNHGISSSWAYCAHPDEPFNFQLREDVPRAEWVSMLRDYVRISRGDVDDFDRWLDENIYCPVQEFCVEKAYDECFPVTGFISLSKDGWHIWVGNKHGYEGVAVEEPWELDDIMEEASRQLSLFPE